MTPNFQMSEADTPNPQSPETHSFSDVENECSRQERKPSDETDYIEVSASPIVKAENSEPQLPNVVELLSSSPETSSSPEPELSVIEGTSSDPSQNIEFGKDADWFTQARKQRQRNRELIKQVAQLEQALAEAQDALQTQSIRTKSADTLITQQAEELYTTKEQVTRLFKELETAHETIQRQQTLIETLSEQLDTAQKRVTQLEQQERFLQRQDQQQTQHLRQVENTCQELRDRLRYQQRQTQQFKAALEKSVGTANTPITSESSVSPQATESPTESPVKANPQTSKAKSIQPWSSQWNALSLEQEEKNTPTWANKSLQPQDPLSEPSAPPSPVPSEDNPSPENESSFASPVPSEDNPSPENESSFASPVPSKDNPSPENESSFASPVPSEDNPSVLNPEPDLEEVPKPKPKLISHKKQSASSEEVFSTSQNNYPSPTIYPLRPTKKRKSLASIDLPSFPRYN